VSIQFSAAVPPIRIRFSNAAVDGRPAETDTECSGEPGHPPAGVRAGVIVTVADSRLERGGGAHPAKRRGDGDRRQRQPGGEKVGGIVGPRRDPAEIEITFVAIPPAGVERIDRAQEDGSGGGSGESAKHIAEHGEKERARHRVSEVFAEALDAAADDLGFVERRGVAADDHGEGAPRRSEIAVLERAADRLAMLQETAQRNGEIDAAGRGNQPECRMYRAKQPDQTPCGRGGAENEQEPADESGGDSAAERGTAEPLHPPGGAAEQGDRVKPPVRIAEHRVESKRKRDHGKQLRHLAILSAKDCAAAGFEWKCRWM